MSKQLSSRSVLRGRLILVAFLALQAAAVFAGAGGDEFQELNKELEDKVEGGGGALIAGVALIVALAGSAMQFSGRQILGAVGVGALAAYGIPIVTSATSALI